MSRRRKTLSGSAGRPREVRFGSTAAALTTVGRWPLSAQSRPRRTSLRMNRNPPQSRRCGRQFYLLARFQMERK
jgi:hypothetical protein